MNRTLHLLGASALTVATACGCVPAIGRATTHASRTATPIVIDESLNALEDKRTQERIAAIVASPEMQKAMGALATSFVRGALDDPETTARIETITVALTRTLLEVVRQEVERMSPELRLAMRRTVRETVADATRQATLTLAEDVPGHLAPALGTSVATQLEEPRVRSALESTSRDIARQVVTGSREAMGADGSLENPGVLYHASRLLRVATWAIALTILGGAIVLVVWVRKVRRNAKQAALAAEPRLVRPRLLRHLPSERAWQRAMR